MPVTKRYLDAVGDALNYVEPGSFTEKMHCRKLFDRNPAFPIFCDKLATREYVAAKGYAALLPNLLWSGSDPEAIPFDDLEGPYIIKPSHRSGRKIIVRPGDDIDTRNVRRLCHRWLRRPHGRRQREWGYAGLKGRILVEQLLPAPEGYDFPHDYRLVTFSGRIEFIRVDSTRRNVNTQMPETFVTLFDREWNRLPWREWIGGKPIGARSANNLSRVRKPVCLSQMIETAECLAAGLDHLRVDFFVVEDRPVVGELTVYYGSGTTFPFPENATYDLYPPRAYDWRNGALWAQPEIPLAKKLMRVFTA